MEKLVFGWEMMRIETMRRQTDYLEILVGPTTASAVCPLCEQSSARVHSAYQRSLQDLPCCGQRNVSITLRHLGETFRLQEEARRLIPTAAAGG